MTKIAPILVARPERDIPLRQIGQPYSHFAASVHTHVDQRAGAVVHIAAKLRIGARIIEGCIFKCVLIRKFLYDAVEYFRESQIDQQILLPNIFSGVQFICI